jgi:hypothetical protein
VSLKEQTESLGILAQKIFQNWISSGLFVVLDWNVGILVGFEDEYRGVWATVIY